MTDKHEVTREFLARFTQAWNDHDIDTLMAHMDEDCEFMASVGAGVNGAHWVGREEVRKGFASLWDNYPDAHFTPEELAHHHGWGHASWRQVAEFAKRARAGRLWLFHHKPGRTDDEVVAIQEEARHVYGPTTAAREGVSFEI